MNTNTNLNISQGVQEITRIFKEFSGQLAHERSHDILAGMAKNKANIHSAFSYFLSEYYSSTSKLSSTSDFVIPIFRGENFILEIGVFGPLITKEEDYAYAMMHDHGDSMLSTINALGPGYNTIIFDQHSNKDITSVKPIQYKRHTHGNIEFIDKDTPHVVFYPADLTITYALWSTTSERNTIGRIRNKIRYTRRKKILQKKYGIKDPTYVLQNHFYPDEGIIKFHPYEVKGNPGTNFLQNFLFKLQQIEFPDNQLVVSNLRSMNLSELEKDILSNYLLNNSIGLCHEGDQMIVNLRNCHLSEYKNCFPEFNFSLSNI